MESFSGHVSDSGEGRWTVQAAVETAVSAPVLSAALYARFASRDEDRFSGKVLSAQRKGFGGHLEPPKVAELMPKPLVLVMGVSGAGKSTVGALLAARLGAPFADADAFHPPANIAKMSRGEPLTDADRWPWLDAIGAWLDRAGGLGRGRRGHLLGAASASTATGCWPAGRRCGCCIWRRRGADRRAPGGAAGPLHAGQPDGQPIRHAGGAGRGGGHDRAVGRAAAGGDRGDGVLALQL